MPIKEAIVDFLTTRVRRQKYHTVVDYRKTTDQLVNDAHYKYINRGINTDTFPVPDRQNVEEVDILFISFRNNRTTEEALRGILRRGYKPVNIKQAIALTTQYPNLQRTGNPIVELGTISDRGEFEHIAAIFNGGRRTYQDGSVERNMHALRGEQDWNTHHLFAVVKSKRRGHDNIINFLPNTFPVMRKGR